MVPGTCPPRVSLTFSLGVGDSTGPGAARTQVPRRTQSSDADSALHVMKSSVCLLTHTRD